MTMLADQRIDDPLRSPENLAMLRRVGIQPGETRNPKGRPKNGGLTLIEYCNEFAAQDLTEQQLTDICNDKSLGFPRRVAADACLQTLRRANLADFDGFAEGEESLSDLRKRGINTGAIKSYSLGRPRKGKRRQVQRIEMVDVVGEWLDRIIDRTHGGVKQNISVQVDAPPVVIAFGVMPGTPEMDALLPRVDAGAINAALESTPSTARTGVMVEGTAIIDAETGVGVDWSKPVLTDLSPTEAANRPVGASFVPVEE